MPLTKLPVKPGVNREVTTYATEGGYFNCDKIRFRSGFVEKIGGWTNYSLGNTFIGTARTMLNWVNYAGYNLLAFGTNQKYYIESGGVYNDITPVANTYSLGTNPIAGNAIGSPLFNITITGHGITLGTFVTVSGATAAGGVTLSGAYEVVGVPDGNTIQVIAASNASSTTPGGGTVVIVTAQVNAGSCVASVGLGWGTGVWGGFSTNPLTGWGLAGIGSTSFPLQLWSQCTFNQDIVFNPRGGAIYYWQNDTFAYSPGVTLNNFIANPTNINSGLTLKGTAVTTSSVVSSTTITIDVADPITSGAYITASSGTIPAGTYVTSAYVSGSLSITLSAPVTIGSGVTVNFSYAGQSVPWQTNRIFSSPIYQFTMALGSNPYDPTNFNTTFDPMIVRWTDEANAYEWVPQTTNQAGEQRLNNGSYIVTALNNRQEILIFSNTALYSVQYIGAPYVFNFQLMQDNISIISPNAAITANNMTFWMGVDRFYAYNGRVETLSCTLKRYVFSNINLTQTDQIVCGYNEGFNEIWWFYPSLNSTVNDSYVIFNYLDNLWYFGSMNRTGWFDSPLRPYPMAFYSVQNSYLANAIGATDTSITLLNGLSYPASGGVYIGSEYITYTSNSSNTLSGCTRGATTPTGAVTVAASHAAYVAVTNTVANQVLYHEDGLDDNSGTITLPISSFVTTSDLGIGDGHHFAYVWRVVPDLTFTNSNVAAYPNPKVYMTVQPRLNSGTAYTSPVDTMTVTESQLPTIAPAYTFPVEQFTGQVYTRIRGRQLAVTVQSVDKGVMWQLGTMRYDFRQDGRR